MPSSKEEREYLLATRALEEFTKNFVRKYPLLLKSGVCKMEIEAPEELPPYSHYKTYLKITERR